MREKLKKYFDLDLRTVLLNTVVGAIIGYVSFIINVPLANLALAIIAMAIINYIAKKMWKITNDKKWWFGNAVVFFFFVWFIVWTIFYTL